MVELQGHLDVQWPDGHGSSRDGGQLVEIGTLRCTKPVRIQPHHATVIVGSIMEFSCDKSYMAQALLLAESPLLIRANQLQASQHRKLLRFVLIGFASQGCMELAIGHHRLEGKTQALRKPLVILQKTTAGLSVVWTIKHQLFIDLR